MAVYYLGQPIQVDYTGYIGSFLMLFLSCYRLIFLGPDQKSVHQLYPFGLLAAASGFTRECHTVNYCSSHHTGPARGTDVGKSQYSVAF